MAVEQRSPFPFMPLHSFAPASRWLLVFTLTLPAACATHQTVPSGAAGRERIEVAFAPDAGAEALVIKVIEEATRFLRLAGYSFTSPPVVRALLDAKKRGIDVKVLIDDQGNRGASSVAAINLVVGAGIPTKTISAYAIHHDKYIVADGRNIETGSFNYTQSAARRNSENVLVVWDDPVTAAKYLTHWNARWVQGVAVSQSY